jgi:CubicO group peptidase (beta-lactamase class C family)
MYNLGKGQLAKDVVDVTRPNQKYSAPEFGMFFSAEDLSHYCQRMLDRGSWNGRRILSAGSLMRCLGHRCILRFRSMRRAWDMSSTPGRVQRCYAVIDGSYGANGASGCVIWMDPSIHFMRIYLTHYFLGDFREKEIWS